MSFFTPKATEGKFVLKDIVYDITDASLGASYQDMELVLFPEVCAETENEKVEYDMREVRLYHNNGFCSHCYAFQELKGKKFVWDSEYNAQEEEAGTLCVQEHEPVRQGTIEILEMENDRLTVKWSGKADVDWNMKYGRNVPFETIFSVKVPGRITYTLDAFRSTTMKMDESTQLEILNLDEFNKEVERVSESRKWDDFNTVLKFCLTREGKDYQGQIIFEDGKNNYKLNMDENCPIKLEFCGVDFNLQVNYEVFLFKVLS